MINTTNKPTVHIVHHIDTEGPLFESIPELFFRIEETLQKSLNMMPTKENLRMLQSSEFVFESAETDALLKRIIDPELLNFKTSWHDIDEMLDRILSEKFRNNYKDSFGNSWIYNWHLLDHVGFLTNPRRREMGYLGVFNFYQQKLKATKSYRDSTQWHFHPIPFNKAANICATSYANSYHELLQIMCRRLIDADWFPVVNRAGFHTIRPDSNLWLEQWLPFDASNQAIETDNIQFADAVNGRFGDWRGAPDDWSLYNPDIFDWRKKGSLKRTISRCLNMYTRFRNINEGEFEKAFKLAEQTGRDVYVGFTNHDFREMSIEMDNVYSMLTEAAANFTGVNFKFNDTISAFRACLNFDEELVNSQKVELSARFVDNLLRVNIINGEIFGPQPFLAIKTHEGTYHSDNFDFGAIGSGEYFYTFDFTTIELKNVSCVSVAANDKYGNTSIIKLKL